MFSLYAEESVCARNNTASIFVSKRTRVIWTVVRDRWLSWKPPVLCSCCSTANDGSKNMSTHTLDLFPCNTRAHTHTETHLWGTVSVYSIHTSLRSTMTLEATSVLDQYNQATFGSGLQFSLLHQITRRRCLAWGDVSKSMFQECSMMSEYNRYCNSHNVAICSL